ncbi:MAG: M23 family metallopeptidase [Mycobacterium sp.]|nr:M23 family metallopeptidase [Mycobacterium sp.]
MRLTVTLILMVTLCPVGRADGSPVRFRWPLRPVPPVTRAFDAPSPDWQHGHRGVDLAGSPGQPVYPAGAGTVVFAGLLAGRAVVSVAHPGGLRTSYEPVESGQAFGVRPGQLVDVDTPMGRLLPGHPGCRSAACLHWGAMWGPASRADYVDPVGLLADTPIRLKPLGIRLKPLD